MACNSLARLSNSAPDSPAEDGDSCVDVEGGCVEDEGGCAVPFVLLSVPMIVKTSDADPINTVAQVAHPVDQVPFACDLVALSS